MSYYPKREYPYKLFIPKQAVGASKVYFDFFNATGGDGKSLAVISVQPVVSGAVAVTGVVSVDLFLTYTSAVGTGGTAATRTGTSLTAATFGATNPKPGALGDNVTARLTPTGGATAAALISWNTVFSEETNAGTYLEKDLVRGTNVYPEEVLIPEGHGIRVVQGSVASVGNIGFNVQFALV